MELSNKLKALLSPFRYVTTDKGGIRIERLLDKSQTSVIVPEGVTVIDYRAFSDAKALKKLYLPTTLVRICEDAFSGCRNLSAVHIGSLDAFLKVKIETFYASPGSNGANFYENGKLITKCAFPEGTKKINDYALSGMRSLKEITLPKGLEKIGRYAFAECSLTSLTLPKSIREIGTYAFWYNRKIPEITVPEGVSELEFGVFGGCEGLQKLTLPKTLKKIDSDSLLHTAITEITIPEGVTLMRDGVFRECRALKSVTLPSTLEAIGDYAFYRCSALESVTIANGLRKIGAYAFSQCNSLREIFLPRSVKKIDHYAFASNESLEKLYLPPYDAELGRDIVTGCPKLSEVSTNEYIYVNRKLLKLIPYTESMGDILLSVEEASLLAKRPLPKQVAFYRLKTESIKLIDDCEAGVSMLMKTLSQSELDALIVKGGVIVGVMVSGVSVLAGESKQTYYAEDNNGAGTKGVKEQSTLMFALVDDNA